jgi:hypothetical protein
MLKDISRARLVGAWCAAVILIGACGVVAGAAITMSNAGFLVFACLAPPAVMLLVWRGATPLTVAELLYAVNQPTEKDRR